MKCVRWRLLLRRQLRSRSPDFWPGMLKQHLWPGLSPQRVTRLSKRLPAVVQVLIAPGDALRFAVGEAVGALPVVIITALPGSTRYGPGAGVISRTTSEGPPQSAALLFLVRPLLCLIRRTLATDSKRTLAVVDTR